jgi:predicted MPP superfamily phosphohydrolase
LPRRIPIFIVIVQSFIFLVHLYLYATAMFFLGPFDSRRVLLTRLGFACLSVCFVAASMLARFTFHWLSRMFYKLAALWLGLVSFFFLAACACWIVYLPALLFGIHLQRRPLAGGLFLISLVFAVYSILNAAWPRVKRVTIRLPNLPPSWRGRTAALVSDLHLGHIRNRGFLQRVVRTLSDLRPDVLFVAGDLFDGTQIDSEPATKPWAGFSAPLGKFFVTGNHEQFSSPHQYQDVIEQCGLRILDNEKVVVDGLQIVGVHYRDSTHPDRCRAILNAVGLDPRMASILLIHTPDRMPIAVEAGISLQLSGHTHRGQFFPFTLAVSRIYGPYAYGLNRFGEMQVYTSCGAGTWGPPMRLGTTPEIVLLEFE